MPKQMKALIKLELCNLYGWNVFRFTKDKNAKRKSMILIVAWLVLIVMMMGYVGGLVYGLILLGIETIVPAYLIMIASLLIFFFGIFKAGSMIFRENGYDILCSLPVGQVEIVVSRLVRMYVENLIVTCVVMIPGSIVYGCLVKPGVMFYVLALLVTLVIPCVPMAGTLLIGAVITGIASRMKHKSLVTSGLSVLLVVGVLVGSSKLSVLEGNISPDMLRELSGMILSVIKSVYPPAVWMGTAIVEENFLQFLMWAVLFGVILAVVTAGTSYGFHWICRNLYTTYAKHDYQMGKLTKDAVLWALCKRELKRYFASSIYVTNTIIGPIMGTVLAAALLFVDVEQITAVIPIPIDVVSVAPYVLSSVFCLMNTTSVSVSMEGKNWWIVKSLPISTKMILDAKILMNLILMLPFYLISEIFLIIALKPGIDELIWMVLIAAILIVLSCVYGLTINLHFPVMNWGTEASVVKQSASAAIGGLGGSLIALIGAVLVLVIPGRYTNLLNLVICVGMLALTWGLYKKNNRTDLREI